jgi:glycosyltransferase involved in cell wall biosynthesis
LDLKRTERFEAYLTRQFPSVLVTSQKDKSALLALKGSTPSPSKLNIFPIGVDVDYFRPDPQAERHSATLVVSGKMSYHANVSMVLHLFERIMPQVWAKRPDVQLCIVGKDPTQEVMDLAAHPNVTVTGMVPDLRPYLQRATAALAPLTYGAGMQFKVIESMACETPVVASPLAVSALSGAVHDKDVLVAYEPDEFAAKVVRLLDDAFLRQSVGKSGRSYVEQHFSWDRIVAQLEEVYHGVIENYDTAITG